MSTTKILITKTLIYSIRKIRLSNYLILFTFCLMHLIALGQNETSAFILAKKGSNDAMLYKVSSTTKVVGSTERSYIKSLAADSKNNALYAVDGGTLGKLDPNSGKFSVIGEIGYGSGELGYIKIDNVYGLTFDSNQNILYASHRMDGFDVLLQINPKTGKIISNSMTNSKGQKVDYKIIIIKTFFFGDIYESKKFVDIAYNNKDKTLYIVHNYFSDLHGINGYQNIDAKTPNETYRISPISKLAGIAFNNDGEFFGTFSDNRISTTGDLFSGGGIIVETGPLKTIVPFLSSDTFIYGLDFYADTGTVQSCSYNLIVNSLLISNTTKIAINSIQSSSKIYGDAEFIAGNNVLLNNNFEAKKSANFEINIDEDVCR